MASTYSDLKFELIGTGEQAGTWGVTTNTNIGTAIEQAIAGKADITFSSTTETLSLSNTNALQDARALYLNLGGTPGGAADLVVPAIEKSYIVFNDTGETVTVKVSGQTGVAVPDGATAWLYNNGTDVTKAVDYLPSLTLGTPLAVAQGGTGGTTSTGTGAVVLASSPTIATPSLTSPTLTTAPYVNGSLRSNIVSVGALDIDCSAGNYFTKSISANSTFTFSNPPSSRAYSFTLEVNVSGSRTITWPATVEWPYSAAPSLSADKTHLFMFVTDDNGATYRGAALVDYTT